MKKNNVTSENMANEKNMSTTDVNSKKMAKKKINDVTSDKMAKEIKKESIPVLFARFLQSLEYYDKTNTLPQFASKLLFDLIIRELIKFRNKVYPETMIIDLELTNE